jgi:hypothetical protein
MEFEFASNATVETLESVPEHIRPFYNTEAGESGFALRDDLKSAANAFDALNKSLSSSRKMEKKMKDEKLTPWLALGESPDAVRLQIEELTAQVKDGAKGTGVNLEKMKLEFEAAKKTIQDEANVDKDKMRGDLQKHMVEGQAAQAIAGAKGDVELLMPHVIRQAKLIQDDGRWQVRVVDAAGDPRGDGKGGFMGVTDLVAEMRTSKSLGRAFDADDKSGAGSGGEGGDAGRPGAAGRGGEALTATQKIAQGLNKRAS